MSTHIMPSQIPPVPIHLISPLTPQIFEIGNLSVQLLIAFVLALIWYRRSGSLGYIALLIGGALASVNEPWLDLLSHCWYPSIHQITAFVFFDRSIPLWVVLAYAVFFGALPSIVLHLSRHGLRLERFYLGFLLIVVLDFFMQVPLINYNMIVYYDFQPFMIAGVPLHVVVLDALAVLLIASIIKTVPGFFSGAAGFWRALLLPPLVLWAAEGLGLLSWIALNSGWSHGVIMLADVFTIVLGFYCCTRLANSVIVLPASVDFSPAAEREPPRRLVG